MMSPTPTQGGPGAQGRPEPQARPAQFEDAMRLAETLRPADRRELAALGVAPHAALADGVARSREAYAVSERGPDGSEGALIALFGVAPHPLDAAIGAPWMMATPALERVARPFLRRSRSWVERLSSGFLMLSNVVDARNAVHIAWLRWCGFTFLRWIPVGPEGRPFLEFARLSSIDFALGDQEGGRPMCGPTAVAAATLASTIAGVVKTEQDRRAANAVARRQAEIDRRQLRNRYEEIARQRVQAREEAAEKIRASREQALRVGARASARRPGARGRSVTATQRDVFGAAARDQEQARRVERRRQDGLGLAQEAAHLGGAQALLRAGTEGADYEALLSGVARGLEETRDLATAARRG